MSKKKKKHKAQKAKKGLQPLSGKLLKGCPRCRKFDQWYCTMAGTENLPPDAIYNGTKKCKGFKKNKHIYF
jgi:hypothetical protein